MSEAVSFVDYYALLGVPTHADIEEIRLAFLKMAKLHHPDRGGTTEQMQQYTTAYRTLKSATSRKAYDLLHDFHTSGTPARYRYHTSDHQATAGSDLSDKEIDDFIDTVFAEYHNAPKPKQKLFTRFINML